MSIHPEVIAHLPVMQRYALKLKRNKDDAHDLVVDALFYFAGKDLAHVDHIKSYVNSYLRFANKGRNKRRKPIRMVSIEELRDRVGNDEDSDVVDMMLRPTYPNQEHVVDLNRLYEQFTPILRQHFFDDMSYDDIALVNGTSKQAAQQQISRHIKKVLNR